MRQFFKRLLLPLAVAAVSQTSIVHAEGIRLIGPGGEVQSSPQFSSEVVRNTPTPSANSEPSTFFGPTTEQDTLWSIATRLKPSANVSVQQTLLAIYRLNPQAFENQNIHSLMPGSTLRVPSLAQVSRVSTQEAVNVMAAHQARLNQTPVTTPSQPAKPQPVVEVKKPAPSVVEEAAPPAPVVAPVQADVAKVEKQLTASDTELDALEEKNHRLRLMVAQMQSEVDNLKHELGDENRIRSEVEKLLQEERVKREEAAKMAPADDWLSNGWMVGLLALIPGLLIGALVLMLLNRRSKASDAQQAESQTQTATPETTVAPITVGEPEIDGLDDELLLDDDLFGDSDDSEKLFSDEMDSKDEADIFADLDESDLDFNLEGEDGQDPFAGIDDDGDLDTDFGSNSGISVSGDEKALGLEEMERALDEATHDSDDDDETAFDLSDDGDMSQEEIESLLASDGEAEDLESEAIDQSMLDELLGGLDDDEADDLDFDTLLDDNLDELMSNTGEQAASDVKMTSDEDLENLFNSIESQADLDELEAQADNDEETALLDELLDDDDVSFDSDSTDLLDELLSEADEDSIHLDDDFDAESDKFLNELLEESATPDEDAFDHDSATLLDEWVEQENQPSDAATDEDEVEASSLDDGTGFLDELLEIEQQAQEPAEEFNSANFKDDLLSSAPEHDPLLDEFKLDDDDALSFDDDEFDFNPEIEGLDTTPEPEPQSEPDVTSKPEDKSTEVANEFGVPQDDDWLLDDAMEQSAESELPPASSMADDAPLSSADFMAELDETQESVSQDRVQDTADEPSLPEENAIDDMIAEAQLESEPLADVEASEDALAAEFLDAEAEEAFGFNDIEQPKETDAAAFADAMAEAELPAETDVSEDALAAEFLDAEAEDEFGFDDAALPEYSEADALADAMAEPNVSGELEAPEQDNAVEQPVTADDEFEFDDLELPEYSEADALAYAMAEPDVSGELEAPVQDDSDIEPPQAEADDEFEFDDLDLPEYSEADALADAIAEPEVSGELEAPVQDDSDIEPPQAETDDEFEFDDVELPEYNEADALADAIAEPEVSGEPEEPAQDDVEIELPQAEADDEFEFDDLELPEYSEADALADAIAEPEVSGESEEPAQDDVEIELPQAEADDEFEFDDLELPEYSEADALADAIAEPEVSGEPEVFVQDDAEIDPPQAETDDEFEFDDLELPEYSESDALADAIAEPEVSGEPAEPVQDDAEIEPPQAEADDEFEFDDIELPEYNEADALADAIAEPNVSGEPEAFIQDNSELESPQAEADDEFDFDDVELPEYSEADALADAIAEPDISGELAEPVQDDAEIESPQAEADDEFEFDDVELPEYNEADALADAIAEPEVSEASTASSQADEVSEAIEPKAEQGIDFESMAHQEFDEQALDSLLNDNESADGFAFDQPMDAKTIDSAGMDIDAMLQMGGEDWNGFSLTPDQQAIIPDEVPEDEQAVWQQDIQNQQPEVETENWGTQEDIADFDPTQNQFMTIDELMAQVERDDPAFNPDDEALKLDVGLNEFPDVIGDISDVDVDNNSEAAGKLDLAKIYMEMNDEKGAVKLLEEAIVDGSDDIRQQAKRLIDVINGRV
ncbi:FimV/HubP family polar landmark protein [Vibrio furnissii]|uniref:FimV/HubP family polar landmark protein n=1 Tax=Vibrio furnissii TaxID=29494 RepID=UPI0001B92CA3|nr:FimV/HubP family polar landmark protein [Vibrio furnissii]EEX42285.1 AAA ATPase [Vibrio furnissii CIP 102972]QDC92495.1 AAA family ATPase [Vibrio furnissii]UON48870.1 AAA family ATPase [Vibrio furnissii]SUP44509.1 AAA ATPase [Vibrio furnissii]